MYSLDGGCYVTKFDSSFILNRTTLISIILSIELMRLYYSKINIFLISLVIRLVNL